MKYHGPRSLKRNARAMMEMLVQEFGEAVEPMDICTDDELYDGSLVDEKVKNLRVLKARLALRSLSSGAVLNSLMKDAAGDVGSVEQGNARKYGSDKAEKKTRELVKKFSESLLNLQDNSDPIALQINGYDMQVSPLALYLFETNPEKMGEEIKRIFRKEYRPYLFT